MALRILTRQERGERLADVRRWAKWGSRELSLALGQDKQYISRIEKGQRKRVDREEWTAIATLCAGRHDLSDKNDAEVIHYLEGEVDWLPHLRLVEAISQPTTEEQETGRLVALRQTGQPGLIQQVQRPLAA